MSGQGGSAVFGCASFLFGFSWR